MTVVTVSDYEIHLMVCSARKKEKKVMKAEKKQKVEGDFK